MCRNFPFPVFCATAHLWYWKKWSSVLARLSLYIKILTLFFQQHRRAAYWRDGDFRHPSLKLPSHHVKLMISTKPARKKNDWQVTEGRIRPCSFNLAHPKCIYNVASWIWKRSSCRQRHLCDQHLWHQKYVLTTYQHIPRTRTPSCGNASETTLTDSPSPILKREST